MDTCQPIFITIKNAKRERFFLLIIEDEELKNQGDPEHYYYAFNWEGQSPNLNFFKTPEEAYKHAMELFPKDKVIEKITSMSMNEFLLDKELKAHYY